MYIGIFPLLNLLEVKVYLFVVCKTNDIERSNQVKILANLKGIFLCRFLKISCSFIILVNNSKC